MSLASQYSLIKFLSGVVLLPIVLGYYDTWSEFWSEFWLRLEYLYYAIKYWLCVWLGLCGGDAASWWAQVKIYWNSVTNLLWGLVQKWYDRAANLVTEARAWANDAVLWVQARGAEVGDWFTDWSQPVTDWISEKSSLVYTWITVISAQLWNSFQQTYTSMWLWIRDHAKHAWAWVQEKGNVVYDWFQEHAEIVSDWVSQQGTILYDWLVTEGKFIELWYDRVKVEINTFLRYCYDFYWDLWNEHKNDLLDLVENPVQSVIDSLVLKTVEDYLYNWWFRIGQ